MKLDFLPEKQNYTVAEGDYRLFAGDMQSPAPQVGKGFVNTYFLVSAYYILEQSEFIQFMDFFQLHGWGAVFQADLILQEGHLELCQCKFVQSSLSVTNRGNAYYVNVQIMAQR